MQPHVAPHPTAHRTPPATVEGWLASVHIGEDITVRLDPTHGTLLVAPMSAYAHFTPQALAEYIDSLLLRVAHPDLHTDLFAPDSGIAHGHHRRDMRDHVRPGVVELRYFRGALDGIDVADYLRRELDLRPA